MTLNENILGLTAKIIQAYLLNNPTTPEEIPELTKSIYETINQLSSNQPTNVVDLSKSFTNQEITCLECHKPFKILKGHLHSYHRLTIPEYFAKWRLPDGYPTVAPAYSQRRKVIAKKIGLGKR